MSEKAQWGGKREGAGRKKGEQMAIYGSRLPADVVKKMNDKGKDWVIKTIREN